MPDVKVRDVKLPDVKIPDVRMPDVKIPDVKLSDIKLGDIKLSDALSAISVPDVKIRNLPDTSDVKAMLPRRDAGSPVPFILVGAMTGILLGLWLATVAPTSSWIRMTADDLKIKFDRWRAGTADAVGDRMDEYLAPAPEMGTTPKTSSGVETTGVDTTPMGSTRSNRSTASSAAYTGTSPEESPESTSS